MLTDDAKKQSKAPECTPLPIVSVVIPVFNDTHSLMQCLEALENQTFSESYEVIVVDNASDEDVESIVALFSHTTMAVEPQRGSYVARNKGVEAAKGSIIAFTDADCIPATDWIEKGVQSLSSVVNCGLVAGRIEFAFRDPDYPTLIELCDSVLFLQQDIYLKHARFGATANVFTFKHVFDKVGLFNQDLKSGGDYDWGQRVFNAGYQQIYAKDACIHHPARYSFEELYKKIIRTTRGTYHLRHYQTYSWNKFIGDIARNLRPPIKPFARARFCKNRHKIRFFFLLTLINYLTAWERIRAQFNI